MLAYGKFREKLGEWLKMIPTTWPTVPPNFHPMGRSLIVRRAAALIEKSA